MRFYRRGSCKQEVVGGMLGDGAAKDLLAFEYYRESAGALYLGDVIEVLEAMPDESVQMVVTSSPYWGLRDYGITGQLGLEATIGKYVRKLVSVFAEVWRVLRTDGTVWLNLADTHYGDSAVHQTSSDTFSKVWDKNQTASRGGLRRSAGKAGSLKPKDLCLVPARVAIALQDAGWWVRQDIIWHKPNPMPSSVRDRCTTAHEYIFLLAKSGSTQFWTHRDQPYSERVFEKPDPDYRWVNQITNEEVSEAPSDWKTATCISEGISQCLWIRKNLWTGCDYYFDQVAISEPCESEVGKRPRPKPSGWNSGPGNHNGLVGRYNHSKGYQATNDEDVELKRNKRDVWTITTKSYHSAHFATFPPDLVEICILAGAPEGGVVLDPFIGSGTVAQVARSLNRRFLGVDLKEEYLKLARKRLQQQRLAI